MTSSISRLVLAIKSVETDETLERWQFDVHTEDQAANEAPVAKTGGKKKEKTEKEVQAEIREIMKQITSSTTFLPIFEEQCELPTRGRIREAYQLQALSLCWRTQTTLLWRFRRLGEMPIRI